MPTAQAPSPDESFDVQLSDGPKIEIRRYGIGKGPCLVITHGNGFAIDGYRVFWEPLLERFELALFDMRNHGRNAPVGADGHHYKQLSIDVGTVQQAIKSRLAPKQPMIGVFHSFSARSAMKHAVEQGGGWDALFLYDPPNVPPRSHRLYEAMRAFEVRLIEFACNRPDRFDSAEGMVKYYRDSRATARWVPQAIEDMGRAVVRPDGEGWSLVCQRELEATIYLGALTVNLWPKASDYGGPVKLIGADPDLKGNVPTGAANQALARENGYAYESIANTGHLLQVERPEECREAMLSYLRELGIA
ncbi:MAG: alpha/beta hydrolase [Betaproteobacteria bacterium]|nr:alpha/beta hydrolase [Betaproteobacteria bacterium]MBI2959484.1 alpha/beta hydrolase [Betaproteobacteria bacterium]